MTEGGSVEASIQNRYLCSLREYLEQTRKAYEAFQAERERRRGLLKDLWRQMLADYKARGGRVPFHALPHKAGPGVHKRKSTKSNT